MLDESHLNEYIQMLCNDVKNNYLIDKQLYKNPKIKPGLRNSDGTGVIAGVTRIGSVQGYRLKGDKRTPRLGKLYYRGIDVEDIVEYHHRNGSFGFEEVVFLLLMGFLPSTRQAELFNAALADAHDLPAGFTEGIIMRSPSKNIMNILGRSVLALYSYDSNPDDTSLENLIRQCIVLTGRFTSIVANAFAVKRHYFDHGSLYIHKPKPQLSVSENFLRLARQDKSYTREEALLLDLMLILHAEHGGGNNSAFSCRLLSSTGTDTYSAIAAAVGSLNGPLHGGANAKVSQMFKDIKAHVGDSPDNSKIIAYLEKLLDGEAGDRSGKIYGLGHAVYTMSDPRAETIKKHARSMAETKGRLDDFMLLESVERLGIPLITKRHNLKIPICANVDMYSGLVYSMLDIPQELFTPLFATARIAGWCAHRIEEAISCSRIIRPAYQEAAICLPYVPIEGR